MLCDHLWSLVQRDNPHWLSSDLPSVCRRVTTFSDVIAGNNLAVETPFSVAMRLGAKLATLCVSQ